MLVVVVLAGGVAGRSAEQRPAVEVLKGVVAVMGHCRNSLVAALAAMADGRSPLAAALVEQVAGKLRCHHPSEAVQEAQVV